MELNPDVDGYTKTLNPRKMPGKTKKQQRVENQKNTETEKSPKWVPVSTYRLPGWIRPFAPVSYATDWRPQFALATHLWR